MKMHFCRETWTLTCKLHVKVTFFMKTWNDPTVITVILPQAVSGKTPIEVQFLTKVLKRIFPKVWDSFPGQYSICWRNSCGNFNENSIRTRSAWSRVSRNPKNQEFMLDSLNFGSRRQRRQPVNYSKIPPVTLVDALGFTYNKFTTILHTSALLK